MKCPACAHQRTRVLDSRESDHGTSVRRRRTCASCGYRFTTIEAAQLRRILIRKRDGATELYQRNKIEQGIRKACEKRPIRESHIQEIVAHVEQDIARIWRIAKQTQQIPLINSQDIGESISERLRAVDPVAYIRFVSVYNAFSTVEEFERAIQAARQSVQTQASRINARQ